MFKRKSVENRRGIKSDSFSSLISHAKFLNKSLSKLDFIGGVMVTKATLNGRIYLSNISPSLSEIDSIDLIIDRLGLVDMVYLYTDSSSVEVYQNKYASHFVGDSYIEISFTNGKTATLYY